MGIAGAPHASPLSGHSEVVLHLERHQSIIFVDNIDNTVQIIERAMQLIVWFVLKQDVPLAVQYTYVGILKRLRSIRRKRQLRVPNSLVVVRQPFVSPSAEDIIALQVMRFFTCGIRG